LENITYKGTIREWTGTSIPNRKKVKITDFPLNENRERKYPTMKLNRIIRETEEIVTIVEFSKYLGMSLVCNTCR